MTRPDLRPFLSSICGQSIAPDAYVGYFVNRHGERMVFIQNAGHPTATLLHADLDWQPVEVTPDSLRRRKDLLNVLTVGEIIIDEEEASWLSACIEASEWTRERPKRLKS